MTEGQRPAPESFRQRMLDGEQLVGTFIKTPTGHSTEILGDLGYDFVVIDEEHAPFDRGAIDQTLLAARAGNIAGLVRIAAPTAPNILSVLDAGAMGVLVPHVASAAKAREVAAAARYRGGSRGFSGSPRAGRYGGVPLWEHVDRADARTTVVAQIEDPEALDEIDAIAAVEGIDALFIGRGDLTVAMGAPAMDAPVIREATERIAAAAQRHGKPISVFVGAAAEARWLKELGASVFVVSSDQGLMRQAANGVLNDFRAL